MFTRAAELKASIPTKRPFNDNVLLCTYHTSAHTTWEEGFRRLPRAPLLSVSGLGLDAAKYRESRAVSTPTRSGGCFSSFAPFAAKDVGWIGWRFCLFSAPSGSLFVQAATDGMSFFFAFFIKRVTPEHVHVRASSSLTSGSTYACFLAFVARCAER